MSRIRTIKPEICTSDQITNLSRDARLTFILMWMFCDDGGIHPASLKRLKREIFPDDSITIYELGLWVAELTREGLLLQYEAEGKEWWQVTGWHHQRIDRPTLRYPSPPGSGDSTSTRRALDEHSLRETKGDEGRRDESRRSRDESSRVEGKGIKTDGARRAPTKWGILGRRSETRAFGFVQPHRGQTVAAQQGHAEAGLTRRRDRAVW